MYPLKIVLEDKNSSKEVPFKKIPHQMIESILYDNKHVFSLRPDDLGILHSQLYDYIQEEVDLNLGETLGHSIQQTG